MNADTHTLAQRLAQALKWDAAGLVTAVVQDHATGQVLMVAHMNAEALAQTLALGETVFFSRSRQALWHKGATSGHTQRVHEVHVDCDGDALLLRVTPAGPACHTGAVSCFFRTAHAFADATAHTHARDDATDD